MIRTLAALTAMILAMLNSPSPTMGADGVSKRLRMRFAVAIDQENDDEMIAVLGQLIQEPSDEALKMILRGMAQFDSSRRVVDKAIAVDRYVDGPSVQHLDRHP